MTDLSTEAPVGVLARLGVSIQAETVWRTLLAMPMTSPDEICRDLEVSRSRLDRLIGSLDDLGLVRRAPVPTGVVTVEPTLAIESHLARAERAAAEQASDFAVLRAMLPALANTHTQSRSQTGEPPGFEAVHDLSETQRLIGLANHRVRTDLRILDHSPKPNAPGVLESNEELWRRGVRDRAVLPSGCLRDPVIFEQFREMQALGHDARSIGDFATRLFIFDDELAVVPIDPVDIAKGAIFVRVKPLIDAMILMFEHTWNAASPIFSSGSQGVVPEGRAARILELLALGNKDESISRTLRIGVRTIRRDVAELKDTLGVSSRAEIVAAAVRKGWL